jgi:hypothetical protein
MPDSKVIQIASNFTYLCLNYVIVECLGRMKRQARSLKPYLGRTKITDDRSNDLFNLQENFFIHGHLYNEMQDEAAQLMDELVTPNFTREDVNQNELFVI